ncbi:hypothetical protein [Brevibacillus sp. MER 51]|uniref:hypothetical protein n=1 Tax=Brevibacillus sp. MER 51 TaxID=2939560 RepID=UPI00203E728C|nr:hypothetical protein [Brevibacillus sp. MER 51]MCM3144323.1 hypothetical protein [Brevibacillus sp. MER 51]
MKKSVASQIAELQRELENAKSAYRQADDDWRSVDVQYVHLKRLREEIDIHKRDLADEISWREREITSLQEELEYEPVSA